MKRFAFALLTLCLFAASAFAQTSTGRLVGTVSSTDGVIAGATVKIVDNATGRERTVTTNDEGAIDVPQLEVGTYTVTVTAPGFKTYSATEVKIDVGREFNLAAALEPGNIQETVTVTAGADVVNSTTGELNTSVTPRQVKELPINGRNPLSLLNLIAGSNPTSSSINGQRSSSVNYTRDGLNVQDNFIRNGFVSDQPTVDDTGEFTVITQNAGAEYGSGSTQVVLVTPRGGSDFHGNAYIFNRNSRFAANNFFNNTNNVPRAFLNRNQFGGTLSGPAIIPRFGEGGDAVKKGNSFFFFNYEGFRLANQVPVATTTLLPAARTGNFTYTDSSGVTRTANVLNGTNLNTGVVVSNVNVFNAAGGVLGIDPLIQSRVLSLLPTAGNGTLTGINYLQTLNFQRSNPETRDQVTGRFDVDVNDRHSFNFVFKRNNITDARTDIAAGFDPATFVDQGGPTTLYVGAYRMSPTPSFTNELRGGYQRSEPFFLAVNSPTSFPFILAGLPVTNPEPSFQSQGRNTDYWNIQDNATWARGNHSLRFGGQAQFYRIEAINDALITPTYSLGTTANTATPGLIAANFPGGIGTTDLARANALRYFLGGVVGSGVQRANAITSTSGFVSGATQRRQLNFDNYALYVSDQWRVTNSLTVNFGVRYELYTPLNNPDQLYLEVAVPDGVDPVDALLDPNGQFQLVGGNAGNPGDFFKADKDNFGPNVSVAWSPTFGNGFLRGLFPGEGRTIFRGGYRVGYNNDEYVRAPDNANLNNTGLGSFDAPARFGGTVGGPVQFRVIGPANAPTAAPVVVPPSAFGPGGTRVRTFAQNNAAAGNFFGTISLIDPDLQLQRNYEYNVGVQREVGFQSVLEVRYVGGYSKEMLRSIDFGQVDIRDNGFLADFLRARENCRLQGATLPGTGDPLLRCTSAAFNQNIVGSQPTPVFNNLGGAGLLTNTTILGQIRNGIPGSLAEVYIINGLAGTVPFRPNFNAGVANFTTNGGRYNYNALQVEFRRRFVDGLSLQANYTWQKTLTNVTGSTDEVNQTRVEPFLDNEDPSRDYGRAIYDRAHTFNFNGLYELPFGRGKRWLNEGGVIDRIFGGFQFSSIVNISSGVPFTIVDSRGTLNRPARSGTQPATSSIGAGQIQDLIGEFRTPNGVFFVNPSVLFATATNTVTGATMSGFDLNQPLPANFVLTSVRGASAIGQPNFSGQVFFLNEPGSTGNLQRGQFNGPMYLNWDAGLLKNIRLTENTRLQLRGEVFNVLNRANFFGGYSLDVNSTSFGQLTGAGNAYAPRIVQFGARFEF